MGNATPFLCRPNRHNEESRHSLIMRILEYLVEMFIQAFGITRPTEAQRRRVTLLLGGVLLVAAALFVAVGVGMILYLHSGH